jgi:hypothetical protein
VVPTQEARVVVGQLLFYPGLRGHLALLDQLRQQLGVVDHLAIVQSVAGSTAQISNVVQEQTTAQVQIAVDPQSLLDTVKTATRNGKTISITLDDAISTPYTTQTAQN